MNHDKKAAYDNWLNEWRVVKAESSNPDIIIPDVVVGIIQRATSYNLTNIQIANELSNYDIKISDLPLHSWSHPDLDANATIIIESIRKQIRSVNLEDYCKLSTALLVSELISHSNIEFITKPRRVLKRRCGRGSSIQIHGVLGSGGGTYISLPKAIQFLTHLTTLDSSYSEVVSNQSFNSILEAILNDSVETITNNILPLGIITTICRALFGKKTTLEAKDAIILVSISQIEPKTLTNLLDEQAKRFRFLDQSILDEHDLNVILSKLRKQKLISIEGDKIKLNQVVVQIN